MTIIESIDTKNKKLYDDLIAGGIQIDFEVRENFEYWAVQPRYKYLIVANSNNPNSEMLAHELLHIKTNILGFLPTNIIVDIFNPNNNHFDTKEFSNIQNLFEHMRMLPLFVEMGYKPENFISNYGNDFFINLLLPSMIKVKAMFILNSENSLKPNISLITEFMSLVICIKNYEIQNLYVSKPFDTAYLKSELRSADENLYDTLYTEISKWVDSGTFQNYQLYANLNALLHSLGYPSEAEWSSWVHK